MSTQVIPHALRTAIWEAYNFRCFYCTELVEYDCLEIDHLIPESFAKNADADLTQYGLPGDWDLTALENLVPSCHRCNSRKLALLANPNQMVLLLTQARSKVTKVESTHEQVITRMKRSTLAAQLSIGFDRHVLTREQVAAILRESQQGFRELATQAVESAFMDVPLAGLSPENVNHLLDKIVRLGRNTFTGLTLTHPNDANRTRTVGTVREYQNAVRENWYTRTTFDMKMEAFFQQAEGILAALSASRPYRVSFIDAPHAGIADLALIPSTLLSPVGDQEEAEHQKLINENQTFAEMLSAGEIEIENCGSSFLSVRYRGFATNFRELLRSDLDGDGMEDILVSVYVRAIGGTLGLGSPPVTLARRSFDGRFEVTKMIPSPVNMPR